MNLDLKVVIVFIHGLPSEYHYIMEMYFFTCGHEKTGRLPLKVTAKRPACYRYYYR